MKKKIILFDIDHTLFDAALYMRKAFVLMYNHSQYQNKDAFLEIASEIYITLRQKENFHPKVFCKMLCETLHLSVYPSELEKIWWGKELLQQSLYKDVLAVFESLYQDKNNVIGIFSTGHADLQNEKIEQLEKFLTAEHIHIFEEKAQNIKEVIRKYQNSFVFFIDDNVSILQQAKKIDPKVVTVWINREGRLSGIKSFTPDAILPTLTTIPDIVQKLAK